MNKKTTVTVLKISFTQFNVNLYLNERCKIIFEDLNKILNHR